MQEIADKHNWALVGHIGDGVSGTLSIVTETDKGFSVLHLPVAEPSGRQAHEKPIFLGVTDNAGIILLDPLSGSVTLQKSLPADAFPAYAYRDIDERYIWFMNDGDKKSGCDVINCGTDGSSVTVIARDDDSPELEKTICVGRGHHVTAFSEPSKDAPDVPQRAFVSNLQDGTISVLAHDPDDSDSWLKVIATINLYDRKYDSGDAELPNGAFPHGMEYSKVSGRLYCLNNGYATVAVIDPLSNRIETTVEMPVSSNLLLNPGGTFIIGKGADRKSDEDHVIGRLTVFDVVSQKIVTTLDLPDIYPSTYRFNPDGSKLYVTTAATGKGKQRSNLEKSKLLIFDTSNLPEIKLIRQVVVGEADCSRRPIAFLNSDSHAKYVFIPNPTDATLTILDSDDREVTTVGLGQSGTEFNFSFWGCDRIYGA